jgi:hypothetical protein
MARYIINSAGASSSVIYKKAPNIRSVSTKPSGPAVLLTAFTIICKHASLSVIRHPFLITSKARYNKACACLTRPIN